MSFRRPAQDKPATYAAAAAGQPINASEALNVANLRAALNAHAATTATLSTQGYFDVSDRATQVAAAERAGHESDIAALFEMIHPDFHPHPDATEEEIDAWYDSVVSGAKKAYSATKKLAKDGMQKVKENTKMPRGVPVTGIKDKVPIAIANLYTRVLAFPTDSGMMNSKENFMLRFMMDPTWDGSVVDSAADFAFQVSLVGRAHGDLDIKLTKVAMTGGNMAKTAMGTKTYSVSGTATTKDKKKTIKFRDEVTIMRDTKDNGEWKLSAFEPNGWSL